jgi:hypothetical protein
MWNVLDSDVVERNPHVARFRIGGEKILSLQQLLLRLCSLSLPLSFILIAWRHLSLCSPRRRYEEGCAEPASQLVNKKTKHRTTTRVVGSRLFGVSSVLGLQIIC